MINDAAAKAAKPKDKKYLLTDVRGLYLEVMPNGKKYWRFRCKNPNGKRSWFTIGEYPNVSIKMARERMPDLRKRASEGRPLVDEPKPDMRFEKFALEWMNGRGASGWSESMKKQTWCALRLHVLPLIGELEVTEITPKVVSDALTKISERGRDFPVYYSKQIISRIFRFAASRGAPVYDPCTVIQNSMFIQTKRHYPTLIDPKDVGELLRRVNGIEHKVMRLAMTWVAYTFCRNGEMCRAEWNEIDMSRKEWRISPEKMKARRLHIVPLPEQMLELLDAMRSISGHCRYIFPKIKSDGSEPFVGCTLLKALRDIGYTKDVLTIHSFRSIASTILNEHGFNSDWIERQLAHGEDNRVRAAYNHAEYLKDRARMMSWYSDHLDKLRGEPINYE